MTRLKTKILLILLPAAAVLYLLLDKEHPPVATSENGPILELPTPPPPTPEENQTPQGDLIGEQILHNYASPNSTVRDDLEGLRRLSLSFTTLVKNFNLIPIGCNGDLADALRGKNPHQHRFLPDKHIAFNEQGQLQDRWGTPLYLHPLKAGIWDIRSAGPDQKHWTDDDLHIHPDGTFTLGNPTPKF